MRPVWSVPSLAVAVVMGLGIAAEAQVPQKLPPTVTVDTLNSVTVQNNRKTAVAVYLEYGRFDRLLGVVPPLGTGMLRLPEYAVSGRQAVRLFAHPNGEVNDLSSQQLWLKPPARLSFVIPAAGDMPSGDKEGMTEVIAPEQLDEATLTVENPRGVQCTVFAAQGSFLVRLGVAPPKGRETVQFPVSVLNDRSLEIVLHPEGGQRLASQLLVVKKGDHLGLRVPEH
ncbi:MAG TPA: hypothetical protein VFV33_17030 [Gemmatimonadaceae bacterium]|nr:hypothetical protein [Gemmatimonadaceae bacterium]